MGSPREEALLVFRKELLQLYDKLKADVEALCKRYEVEINCWYSPSTIPQPKFIIDGVGFDADELYNENNPKLLTDKIKRKTRKVSER